MKSSRPSERMLQNYVLDKLSAEDEETVEIWLLDHPEAIDDLNADLAFAQYLKQSPKPQNSPKVRFGFFDWLMRPQFAAASVTALAIALGTGYWLGKNINDNQIDNTIVSSVERIPLEITRNSNSDEFDNEVNSSNGSLIAIFEINIRPWLGQYQSFKIQVSNNTRQETFNTEPNWNHIIEAGVNIKNLTGNTLELKLYGVNNNQLDKIINTYRIKINDTALVEK